MQADYILCCDWGTTGFRLRLTNLKAEVIAETHAENGILSHYNSWQSRNDENLEHRFDYYLQYIQSQMGEIRHPLDIDIAKLPLVISGMAISSAINSINANYKEGVNGFETEISEFGKCFGTSDFKEGTTAFIEKRNYAELINTHYSKEIYRKTDKYYAHIEFKLIAQRMIPEKEYKVYDHIKFEIECVPEEIFDKLSELAKDPDKLDDVWKIHEKEKLIFERECFFDITSFYGRNK